MRHHGCWFESSRGITRTHGTQCTTLDDIEKLERLLGNGELVDYDYSESC